MELEDDLYFADLSKEIALLLMDEHEDPLASYPADSLQVFPGAIQYPPPQFAFLYEQALRRDQSKGTGVFIPQATQPIRRKQRKGRYNNSYSANYQKQSQDTTIMASQAPPIKDSLKSRN
ncbi:uncharacterized protein LOC130723253 [Lotus japonicus]|uniref:Uncharacterized protein n=1 Tax=Lotus japonicus TaxID=34305 RepID=I3S3F9_LOTJA|nr:uncharacterized protein LOC130723253 [Lotus japonicus]AFK34801.1 unknown [Lotus japonicus]